jgi:hypothetical protein
LIAASFRPRTLDACTQVLALSKPKELLRFGEVLGSILGTEAYYPHITSDFCVHIGRGIVF